METQGRVEGDWWKKRRRCSNLSTEWTRLNTVGLAIACT